MAEVWSGKTYRKRKEYKTEKEEERKEKERKAGSSHHSALTRNVLSIITVTKWYYLSEITTITRANKAQRLYPFKSNKYGNQQIKQSASYGTYKIISTYDSVVKGSS